MKIYEAGDYAGVQAGKWRMYYGYEETVPEDDEEGEWAFVVKYDREEVCRYAASSIPGNDRFSCATKLLGGIARMLDEGLLTIGYRALSPE